MRTSATEFRLLGDVELRVGADVVDIGHARQRCVLLALLVDANRVVPVDELIDRVWAADRPPQRARGALYNYVSRIRQALTVSTDVTVTRRSGGYLLTVDARAVDLHLFDQLTAEARTAAEVRTAADDDRAASLFARALGLWRGEAFATLDTPWLNAVRDSLNNRRAAAELDRADVELRRGRHHEILPDLTARAAALPFDERLAGQLMLALYRCGRQADALDHFRLTRSGLIDDLGVEPGPALRDLHRRILSADPELDGPPAHRPDPHRPDAGDPHRPDAGDPRPPAQLPPMVAGFTGRADELSTLDGVLAGARDEAGVVLIAGTPGVGKTTLALRWAHRIVDRFPDGQLYLNLRGYDPGQPVPSTDALAGFLRALGVPGPDIPLDLDERGARYRTTLAGRRVLVVLDNASSAEQVRPLLPGGPGCLAVVTSRDRLTGLVALDGAHRLALDPLPGRDAVALLGRLIGTRVDADRAAAAVLAEQCARLPLTLRVAAELAAGQPHAELADLTRQLGDQQERLDLLDSAGEVRTAVRSVFSWSYRQLPPDAARAFRVLGLHPGQEFDAYAVAALAGVTVARAARMCAVLVRASLIQVTGPGRHSSHDLLRAYAASVNEDGVAAGRAAQTRLFDHYLASAATAMDTLHPAERHKRPRVEPTTALLPALSDPDAARAWLDAERANLVAVCVHTAANGWPGHTVRLAQTLFRYLDMAGHHAEAVTVHTEAHRAAGASGDRVAAARALNNLAAVFWWRADHQRAADHYRRAAAQFRAGGDLDGEADALTNLGAVHRRLGELGAAAEHHRQALARYRRTGNAVGQAHALTGLGVLGTMLGDFAPAGRDLRAALTSYLRVGKTDGAADALSGLGRLLARQGDLAGAVEHHEAALDLYRRHGYQGGEAGTLNDLGHTFRQRHDLVRAADLHRRALALYRQGRTRNGEAAALNGLGETLRAAGSEAEAYRCHAEALAIATEIGDRYEQAHAHDGIGATRQVAGDSAGARAEWTAAARIYGSLGVAELDDVQARLHDHAG